MALIASPVRTRVDTRPGFVTAVLRGTRYDSLNAASTHGEVHMEHKAEGPNSACSAGSPVTYKRLRGVLLASAAVVALAGCGASKSPSVAAIPAITSSSVASSANNSSGAAGSPSSQTQVRQDALTYAHCMRANGVPDFPDPGAGGGFVFPVGGGVDPSSAAFKAAQTKCESLLPNGGPPAPGAPTHPSTQALAQMVKVAQCMRRHGIADFPDPRTTMPSLSPGGGEVSNIDGVILAFPASLDTQSPAFTQAAAACRFPLHNH